MSYYGATSALDAYTNSLTGYGLGGSTRFESLIDRKPLTSTYSSDYSLKGASGRSNKSNDLTAYEKYCRGDYLSELTGLRTSAYTTPSSYRLPDTSYVDDILSDVYCTSKNRNTPPIPSSSSSNAISSRRKYTYEPEQVDLLSNKFGSQSLYKTSGGYSSESNNQYLNDNDTIGYSSKRALSRPGAIGSAPAYDRFGKELSNYERWKISNTGPSIDDDSNNNKKNNRRNNESHTNNNNTSSDGFREITITRTGDRAERDIRDNTRNSTSRIKSSKCDETDDRGTRNGSRFNRDREYSVIPTTEKEPTITGSRFSAKTPGPGSNNMIADDGTFFVSERYNRKSPPSSSSSYFPSAPSASSSSYKSRPTHSFPVDVQSKLSGYDVRDVKGDGGCYYRCLSVYFTGSEENYNQYRREVMSYIKQNLENYSSMIKSEVGYASTNDYFSRKTRFDRQEFAETTEIIATCCVYNINVHVLAVVPGGRRSWEWLHFDPSIGSGKPSTASRDIYLYNQGSVHFMLCTPK